MPYKSEISNIVTDWWQFIAYLAVAWSSFLIGRERQRFKIQELAQIVTKQGERIEALERQGNAEAVQLAKIVTSQAYIMKTLDEIKQSLKGKADR